MGASVFMSRKISFDDFALSFGEFEWQHRRNPLLDRIVYFDFGAFAFPDPLAALQGQTESQPKQLFEYQTPVRRTASILEFIKRALYQKENEFAQSSAASYQTLSLNQIRRQRFRNRRRPESQSTSHE
jgi:hypothetical protein